MLSDCGVVIVRRWTIEKRRRKLDEDAYAVVKVGSKDWGRLRIEVRPVTRADRSCVHFGGAWEMSLVFSRLMTLVTERCR